MVFASSKGVYDSVSEAVGVAQGRAIHRNGIDESTVAKIMMYLMREFREGRGLGGGTGSWICLASVFSGIFLPFFLLALGSLWAFGGLFSPAMSACI